MKPLASGYSAEFDTVDSSSWSDIISQFSDANLYQTWSYDASRYGENNLSHFVLMSGGRVVAVAQARMVRIPLTRLGAAYVRWGPLWQPKELGADLTSLRMAIRELRNEYVCRRGLVLRLLPALYGWESERYRGVLLEEGYVGAQEEAQRTLVLDIQPTIDELRTNLGQKWRNGLNRAEKSRLEIVEGTGDDLFGEFIGIYQQLLERKRFSAPNTIGEFRIIQRDLPDKFKMRIFLCRSDQSTSSGAIFSAVGETGVYLFGATNDLGMKDRGSYLLQWKAIQWMKNTGCRYYNLNGISPDRNSGTYHFKAGVAGRRGMDVHYIGRFSAWSGPITKKLAESAEVVWPIVNRMAAALGRR